MKKSTKAVLLSGLVFPGVGHLYLKRWVPGAVLCAVAACALYYIVSITLVIALDIVQKIESGAVSPDINAITTLVSQQISSVEQASNLATLAFGVCWLLGIIDALRQGRAQDNLDEAVKPGNQE